MFASLAALAQSHGGTLVFGAGGRLWGQWCGRFPGVRGLTRRECDVTDASAVQAAVGVHAAGGLLNCAAMTDGGSARSILLAPDVNVVGARNVAEAGEAGGDIRRALLIGLRVNALNVYGQTKLASESVGGGAGGAMQSVYRSHWLFRETGAATRKVRVLTSSRVNPITGACC